MKDKRINAPWEIRETYDALRGAIYGQEQAVRAAVAVDAARKRGEKRNVLFVGPTGCGKTEIFRRLKEISGHVYIIDASKLTAEGWKGSFKLGDVFSLVLELERHGGNGEEKSLDDAADAIENGIIVLDEIDKAFIPAGSDYTAHIQLQGEMLAVLEGTDVIVSTKNDGSTVIDTRKISFVLLGAFQGIYEKRKLDTKNAIGFAGGGGGASRPRGITVDELVEFGMLPELAGRMDRIVTLDGMTEDDYLAAMRTKGSVLDRAVADSGAGVAFSDEEIRLIAREAAENGLGLRYIKKQVDRKLDEKLFADAGIPALENCP